MAVVSGTYFPASIPKCQGEQEDVDWMIQELSSSFQETSRQM